MRGKKATQAANRRVDAVDNATAELRARHSADRAEWTAERAALAEEINKLRGELTREVDRRAAEQAREAIADAERRVEEAVEEGRRKAGRLYEVAVLNNPDFDAAPEIFVKIAEAVGMQPGELLVGNEHASRRLRRATHGTVRRSQDTLRQPDGPPGRNAAKHLVKALPQTWSEAVKEVNRERTDGQEQA